MPENGALVGNLFCPVRRAAQNRSERSKSEKAGIDLRKTESGRLFAVNARGNRRSRPARASHSKRREYDAIIYLAGLRWIGERTRPRVHISAPRRNAFPAQKTKFAMTRASSPAREGACAPQSDFSARGDRKSVV